MDALEYDFYQNIQYQFHANVFLWKKYEECVN